MTKYFRVGIRDKNGERFESRTVVNLPDVPDDEVEQLVRKEWAKHYPGQEYTSITMLGADQPAPQPPTGAFDEARLT